MLTLGREVRMPADITFSAADEALTESYYTFVGTTRDRMTEAYREVRIALRKAAERNKK